MKIIKISILTGLIIMVNTALTKAKAELISQTEFLNLENNLIKVVAKKTDMTLGLPYLIEVFETCGTQIKLIDAHTVCDFRPKSIKLTTDKKNVSIMIRKTSAEAYNKETQNSNSENLKNLEVKCKQQITITHYN
jgi:hypothetical protein